MNELCFEVERRGEIDRTTPGHTISSHLMNYKTYDFEILIVFFSKIGDIQQMLILYV